MPEGSSVCAAFYDKTSECPARLKVALALHHLLASFGLYTLTPVLAVLLSRQTPNELAVGLGLFGYGASVGLSAVLIGPWLSRISYLPAMMAGVIVAAVGFGSFPYAHDTVALVALLVVAGLGMSVHSLLSRVLVAQVVPDDTGRQRLYSTLVIAINVAAAVGPFLASLVYVGADARPLLAVVSVFYLLAAVALPFGLPVRLRPAPTGTWSPISRSTLQAALRDRTARRTIAVTVVGTFLAAQFGSAFAVMVAEGIESAAMRGLLLAAPSIGIVLLQTAVTALVSRRMRAGTPPYVLIGAAVLGFGATALILGSGLAFPVAAGLVVVALAFCEPLFHPTVCTAFAGLRAGPRMEMFHLRQLSWTFGGALGAFCGGALFLRMHKSGWGEWYWSPLGAVALTIVIPVMMSSRTRPTMAESR